MATTTEANELSQLIAGDFQAMKEIALIPLGTEKTISRGMVLYQGLTYISAVAFDGDGLNDATSAGSFSGTTDIDFVVEIDGTGTPDTFKWSDDGGATWDTETVDITGSAQTLSNGVTITFAATTGHTSGNKWTFMAGGNGFAQLLNDGTKVARAIAVEGVVVPVDEEAYINAYFTGEYRSADLVWPDSISVANKNKAIQELQDRGVIIK